MTLRRGKVLRMSAATLEALIKGEGRIKNVPTDCRVLGSAWLGTDFGVLVASDSCAPVPYGQPWPVVQAVLERKEAGSQ